MNKSLLLLNILHQITKHPLNKGGKIRAVTRFLNWQIGSFFIKWPVIYPFVESSVLVVEKGMGGATGNIYNGLHEYQEMMFLLHFLTKNDLFIDIGANIGSYTILSSANCGARSIAFEPISKTFEYLQRNIVANSIQDRVQLINKAVGSKNETNLFTSNLDAQNHVLSEGEKVNGIPGIAVGLTTLDDFFLQGPILIKIDVEGFESEVVSGGMRMLSSQSLKAIIIELNGSGKRYGKDEGDIHATLINLGFLQFIYNPFTRQLISIKHWGKHNTIYVRDLDYVRRRVEGARKYCVNSYIL